MLQVHDIGPQITAFENTYDFHIGHDFFGRIRKDKADNNIGSTLEKATFSVIQENKTDRYILCILCIGNEKGAAASLLFISKKNCYMFDPHSRNSCGLPIDSGTSILASFKSRQNMISHIRVINSVSEDIRQNPMDLYSMCVVSFNQVNMQMQSYFIDQKYQYLKSKPLAKEAEEEKIFEYEKYQMNNKKGLLKRDIAKHKNTQKWKIAAEKTKSKYSQTEKSQNQTTENGEKTDNKKSAWKRNIQKQIKLKDRERQCKCRENIQKICLSKKDSKSLRNESAHGKRKSENEICTIVKKNKQVEDKILAKNENKICPGTASKKDTTGCNNCYTQSEKSQNQTTENDEKTDSKKSAWKRNIQKQIKLKDRERQCKRRKNIQKICLSKKDSKSLKNESAPGKRKSENEICTIVKKNKQVEDKILAKNENKICPGTASKKDTTGCNNCYTQSEKSQNQTTENGEKTDNKKSAWKRNIQKQIKLKDRERQCKRRKNIQKICLSKKDCKSLKNESTPGKRKSENEICTIVKKKQTSRRASTSQKEKK